LSSGEVLEIASVHADEDDILWHEVKSVLPAGILEEPARLTLDRDRRLGRDRRGSRPPRSNRMAGHTRAPALPKTRGRGKRSRHDLAGTSCLSYAVSLLVAFVTI
jgi:hypothetical protein